MTKRVACAVVALAIAGTPGAQTVSFADACKSGDEGAVMAAGLANPGLAQRDYSLFAELPFAQKAVEAFALADPEEAVGVAGRTGEPSAGLRDFRVLDLDGNRITFAQTFRVSRACDQVAFMR